MNKSNKIEITLKPQWFPHLPAKLDCTASALLPAFAIDPISAATAFSEMQQAGILDNRGNILPDLKKPLQTLAQADRCSRLKLLCEGDLLEYQVFWLGKSSEPVALSRAEDGFILTAPADVPSMLELLAEFTGIGSFAVIPPIGAFDKIQAITLAACHDLTRQTMFQIMGGKASDQDPTLTCEQIYQHIHNPDLSSESLVWVIQSVIQQPLLPDINQLQRAIDSLEKGGYLTNTANGYVPEEDLNFLCRRMLVFNSLIKLESMRIDSGALSAVVFTSIQCGLRDLLMIEATGEEISLNGISSQQLLLVLREFLTNPEAVKIAGPEQEQGDRCECGKPYAADARFCKFCGKPRPAAPAEEKPSFCSKCGNALKSGKTFCTKCGNKTV